MDTGSWEFKKDVANIFDKHVNQSVPIYSEIQKLIIDISQFFIRKNDVVYDIGTSTGETLYQLKNNIKKPFIGIGIDNSIDMINKAKDKLQGFDDIQLYCSDIKEFKFNQKSNLMVCNLTLQFIPMEKRVELLNDIYKNLNIGGALVVVEKTYANSGIHQEIFTQLYHDFKETNGLSEKEIRDKDKSLRSVLVARRNSENQKMLNSVGFVVDEFYRHLNFVGYLAIKTEE